MHAAEKIRLYRELARLTAASFHLDRSLTLLLGQNPSPHRRRFLHGLQQGLQAGCSVAESIRTHNRRLVTDLELVLIEAGERSGRLAQAFSHLDDYFSAMEAARLQARRAMIYPLVLLHLAILLPQIPAAITAPEGSSPWPRALASVAVLWAVLFGGHFLWRLLSRQAFHSRPLDAFLNAVPFVGPARRHWALARFSQVFHAGLLAAFRMSEATHLAGEASQSGVLRSAANSAALAIEQGEPLSLALASKPGFPSAFIQLIAIAEESGTLDQEMERWSKAEAEAAQESIARAALWLPKIGYALVVVFVIWQIFGMMQAYFGSMTQLLEGV